MKKIFALGAAAVVVVAAVCATVPAVSIAQTAQTTLESSANASIFSELANIFQALQKLAVQFGVSTGSVLGAATSNTSTSGLVLTAPVQTLFVNTWNYVTDTHGSTEYCYPSGLCHSNAHSTPTRQVDTRTDALSAVFSENTASNLVGVWKDGSTAAANHWLRCFGSAPGNCNALYPPNAMALTAALPVLPAASVSRTGVTPGGVAGYSFKTFYVNPIDPNTCIVSGQTTGAISHSQNFFLIDSYNFGGQIGIQHDVLVDEDIQGYPAGATNPWAGNRLERYYFVPGYGYVHEEAWLNSTCGGTSTAPCSTIYDLQTSSTASNIVSPNVPSREYCAPGATGAQIVSQSVPTTMTAGASYPVSITVKNTGGAIWTAAANYKLGSQSPLNNTTWGVSRASLAATDSILPGDSKTFTFTVTAPSAPGTYLFSWRMLQEGVESFGDSVSTQITVHPVPPALTGSVGVTNASGTIVGWVLDPANPTANLLVNIYVNGPIGQGQLVGQATATVPRGDVNKATGYAGDHGFTFAFPISLRGASHTVYVYAVTNGSGMPLTAPVLLPASGRTFTF